MRRAMDCWCSHEGVLEQNEPDTFFLLQEKLEKAFKGGDVSPRPSSTQICWCFGSFCMGASSFNSILQFRAHRDGSPSPCFTNLYIQKTGKYPQKYPQVQSQKNNIKQNLYSLSTIGPRHYL